MVMYDGVCISQRYSPLPQQIYEAKENNCFRTQDIDEDNS